MKKNGVKLLVFLILVAIAIFLYMGNGAGTIKQELKDFAIEDTASVHKIFLADTDNRTILLEKESTGNWTLNGKGRARQDAVDLLLKTFRRIQVKSPVAKSGQENVIRNIAGTHVKVEIFQGGDKPSKIYYVGSPVQDHLGTYMLLETPELGKSSVPFVMYMPGFFGDLSARFFTNPDEWKYTGIFNYNPIDIKKIDVDLMEEPDRSFEVTFDGGNNISLFNANGQAIPFDSIAVKNYILQFRKLHFEIFIKDEFVNEEKRDSILNSTPYYVFQVTDNSGMVRKLSLWHKEPREGDADPFGNPLPYDPERMYGLVDGEDFVYIQYFVFDKMLKSLPDFSSRIVEN